MPTEFTRAVKNLLKQVPAGRVVTYGQVARAAGKPRAARQVAWILHSSSGKDQLPWHRVVNRLGRISLPEDKGGMEQRVRLEGEGVVVSPAGRVDLTQFQHAFGFSRGHLQ